MGGAAEEIRLTVPAQPNYVQIVRVAVRVVAGRAGCSDDARSRLQAAVGAGFFEVVDRAAPGSSVLTLITWSPDRMEVALSSLGSSALDPTSVVGLADGHGLSDDDRTLHLWVAR